MTGTTRRSFLASSCVLLSGCALGRGDPNTSDGEFERRSVSLVSQDDAPESVPASLSVEVVRNTATPEHTVAFEITLTNDSDSEHRYNVGTLPVSLLAAESDPPGYVLLQPTYWSKEDRKATCWENEAPEQNPYRVVPEERKVRLEPAESDAGTAVLWGTSGGDCWPTGQFAFRGPASYTGETFEWGFEFSVSE